MDNKTQCKIPYCGGLPGEKLVVGAKQLRKAVTSGKARWVYLAQDADPILTEPLEKLCRERDLPIAWVQTMAELGRLCGIEVGASAAAVLLN